MLRHSLGVKSMIGGEVGDVEGCNDGG
jgi:hypothetical protein